MAHVFAVMNMTTAHVEKTKILNLMFRMLPLATSEETVTINNK